MILTVDEHMHPELAEAVRRLVDLFQPERIYLFGSQARGEATEHSDYDILVIVPHSDEPHHRRARAALHVLWEVDLPIEVLVLTRYEFELDLPVIASLPSRVASEGRVLYAS